MEWFLLRMDNIPLVTVILPSYNHAQYVRQAIFSVLNQTYSNIELIVIDDGSSDNSVAIIENLKKQHDFIFIKQDNCGVYQTISRALNLARGKYISPFSSDDIYCEDKIESLVGLLEEHPEAAVAYGKIILIDNLGQKVKSINEPYRSGYILKNLLCGDFFINGLAALVRKEIYVNARSSVSYIDDLPIWLSIAEKYQYLYCDKYLAQYRRHTNHLSGDLLKMINSELSILDKYKGNTFYADAMKCWNLRWFYNCSSMDKRLAIHYLSSAWSLKIFFNFKFYLGLLKLLGFWKYIR